jgi:hypothetical protein
VSRAGPAGLLCLFLLASSAAAAAPSEDKGPVAGIENRVWKDQLSNPRTADKAFDALTVLLLDKRASLSEDEASRVYSDLDHFTYAEFHNYSEERFRTAYLPMLEEAAKLGEADPSAKVRQSAGSLRKSIENWRLAAERKDAELEREKTMSAAAWGAAVLLGTALSYFVLEALVRFLGPTVKEAYFVSVFTFYSWIGCVFVFSGARIGKFTTAAAVAGILAGLFASWRLSGLAATAIGAFVGTLCLCLTALPLAIFLMQQHILTIQTMCYMAGITAAFAAMVRLAWPKIRDTSRLSSVR